MQLKALGPTSSDEASTGRITLTTTTSLASSSQQKSGHSIRIIAVDSIARESCPKITKYPATLQSAALHGTCCPFELTTKAAAPHSLIRSLCH